MKNFNDYCRDFITDELPNFVGQSMHVGDIFYNITLEINANGTCTFDRNEAVEYIKEWWNECGDYVDEYIGEGILLNPFNESEKFMVCMVINGVENMLADCECLKEIWDDKVEITQDLCDTIIKEIQEIEITL